MLLLAIVNVLVLGLICAAARRLAVYLYAGVNFLLFLLPVFLGVLLGVFHPRYRPEDMQLYPAALLFILFFNVTFGLAFLAFQRALPEVRPLAQLRLRNPFDQPASAASLVLFTAVVLVLAAGAKLMLNSLGAFRMLDIGGASVLLQFYKEIAGFDLLLLAYLGELKARRSAHARTLVLLYAVAAAFSLGAALTSGSRFQVVIWLLLVAIAHRDFLKRHVLMTIAGLVVLVPWVAVLFPLLSYYRRNGYDFMQAIERTGSAMSDRPLVLLEITTTRLNYAQVLTAVMQRVKEAGPAGGATYWNNFIGIIPRALWPGKPEITNDSRGLGHLLGIVTRDDRSTSIGLQIIGEAFYEFGWLGLWVAVFQALMFASAQKQLGHRSSPMFYALYITTILTLLSADGYFAIVPGMIWLFIGVTGFLLLANVCMRGVSVPRAAVRQRVR